MVMKKRRSRVLIGIPLAGPMIYWRAVASWLELDRPFPTDLSVFQGALIDRARNHLVDQMLQHPLRPTHLFFLDSDIVPAADTLTRLLAHRQPIVSGLYRKRTPPHEVMAITHPPTPSLTLREGVQRVDFVGAGCLLIERRVFEKIRPPWFAGEWRGKNHLSEDFYFCEKARKAGFKIWLDPSVRPLHIEPMGVGTGKSGRAEFIPLV